MQQSSMDATALYDHSAHNDVGDATMARWLQSVGLQHQASTGVDHRGISNLTMQQGCVEQSTEEKQRLFRQMRNLNVNCKPDYEAFASTPQGSGGISASGRYYSPELSVDFGAGLLDLHSMDDSELLSEHVIPEPFEPSPFIASATKAFNTKVNVLDSQQKKGESDAEFPSSFMQNDREYSSRDNNVAKIKVIVRKRPLNKKEIARRDEDIVDVDEDTYLTVHEPKLKVDLTSYVEKHGFCFDAVLNEYVTNDEVYRVTVEPIIPTIFQGVKATCFAYGQTGSGKTYTMKPLPLRASEDLVRLLHHPMYQNQRYKLWLSYFEIYGGKLYDLLSDRKKLTMREDGRQQVCIVGLQEYEVYDVRVVKQFIEIGNAARSTGSTGANEESSRSHAILQLVLKRHHEVKEFRRNNNSNESKTAKIVGKISFIDLAGNERGADTTDNDRQTRIEGAEINKSLLALKECIRALDNDRIHIPFRGSKLTEVLRDSFVGNSKTVMISCISPNSSSCEHTLNTLRYADRVKSLSKTGNPKKEPGPDVLPQGPGKLRPAPSSSVACAEDVYNHPPEPKYFNTSKRVVEKELSPYNISTDALPPRRAPNHSYHGREESPEPSALEEDNFDSRSISGGPWNHKVSSTKLSRIIDTEEVREVSSPPQIAYEDESSFGACRTYKMSSGQLSQNTDTREEMRNASPSRQRVYKNESIVGSLMSKQLPQNIDVEEVQKLPPLRLRAYEDKSPDKHSQNAHKMYPKQHCQSTNPEEEEVFKVSPPRGRAHEDETSSDGSRTYKMSTKQNYQITDAREMQKASLSLQRPYGSEWHDKQEVWSTKQITITSGLSAASNKNQHERHSSANYTKHEPGTPFHEDRTNELQEKEVETLVSAHRKEIEESMEIVRDEMKLLAEVDQPGSLIDNYVAEMSFILSRKAASLASLQARLARFQHRLREEDILNRKRTHYQ